MKNMEMVPGLRVGVVLLAIVLFTLGVPDSGRAAPGDLDPTFGSGGKVTTDFGGDDQAFALALQPDGKIVAAGSSTQNFALARYNADGSLDATFGSGGKVTTNFGLVLTLAHALALQPDGKIVVAGESNVNFALARYNPDGSLDATFGTGGKVITDFGGIDRARALALQPDGKIVVAGESAPFTGLSDFALARYNPDGSLDASFGTGGKVTTDFGGTADRADALALQPDGKIVLAGGSSSVSASVDFALARYNPDGSLDASFGTGGKVITDFGNSDAAFALALQPDGKIIVAGVSTGVSVGPGRGFALARYNPDGSLDATFGTGGKVITNFGGAVAIGFAESVALQPDGKIVVTGPSFFGNTSDFALARYNPDGSLDASFGTGGKVTTDFGGTADQAHALALQPDGKLVLAGSSGPIGSQNFALARYKGDPIPTVSIATNQPVYHAGDRMIVTVTTDPGETTDRWYLLVALVTPVNTPADLFFIYRFDPVVELITLQEAISRPVADIAARPLSVVVAESFTILDVTLPALPVGSYQWLTAFFSENLTRISNAAGAPFTFE